ncbi:MAG: GlxA family transcriptional regulator [Geminicoccaceae bacterium]
MAGQQDAETIAFVLVPNFSMIAFSSAVEILRITNRVAEKQLYNRVLLSRDGGAVSASNGVTVLSDQSLTEFDYGGGLNPPTVVICAGAGSERYHDARLTTWLRKMDRLGATIGAICTGSYILARSGLLDGYKCTVHWENIAAFREEFPDIDVSADLFEIDRNRFTGSGGTAALDLMLHRVAEKHGNRLATLVSEMCLLDRMRGPNDRQRLPLRVRLGVHHPKLIAAIEMMEANVEEPLSQEELAGYIGLSRRQLERLFRKHLGRTPAQFYLELRLERARHLLYQTEMPIMDVALACGFVSPSHFSTCYRTMYGKTPRAERMSTALTEAA